jgi:cbb3-type cytochrome oxidase subunit 3
MKLYVWFLAVLGLCAMAVAAFVLTPHRRSDCSNQIVIIRGRDDAPMECVCLGGVLASCFEPGP